MDFWMKGFHATAHHFRESSHVRHFEDVNSFIAQDLRRAARTYDFNAKGFQLAREVNDAGFVRNANERAADSHEPGAVFIRHIYWLMIRNEFEVLPHGPYATLLPYAKGDRM